MPGNSWQIQWVRYAREVTWWNFGSIQERLSSFVFTYDARKHETNRPLTKAACAGSDDVTHNLCWRHSKCVATLRRRSHDVAPMSLWRHSLCRTTSRPFVDGTTPSRRNRDSSNFHNFYKPICIRLGQVRRTFVNVRKPFWRFRQRSGFLGLPTWPYKGCRHSGSRNLVQSRQFTPSFVLQCILGAPRHVVPAWMLFQYGALRHMVQELKWHQWRHMNTSQRRMAHLLAAKST
jgi:hypothetical protein